MNRIVNRFAVVCAIAGSIAAARFARATEYFVAPSGNDAHAGSKDQPFATLTRGVNQLQPGDTLWVRGGVYRETVIFPHSGTPGRPIAVKAMPGERVLVSGCDPVAGWKLYRENIWQAPMNWTLGRGRNQVFAGDEVMIEARHPNAPAPGLGMYVSGLSPLWPTFGAFEIPQDSRIDKPGRITSKLLDGQPDDYWKGALYYGVHYEGWCGQTGLIESSKSGEINVADRTNGWWFGSSYGGKYAKDSEDGRGMIVGHMHALDQPREWHWQDDTLYFIPPAGTDPNRLTVEAKRRQLAFDLSGQSYILVQGVHVRAASARLDGSHQCTFDNCHFTYLSHFLLQYNVGQVEKGRDTIKSGETGIYVGGSDNAFLNCSVRISAGTAFHVRGYHHTIHNCLIDEVSYTAHYLNAITDAVSDYPSYEGQLIGGHVITYNTMRNAGRHFFNICGNGTSLITRDRSPMDYAATLFAHNHCYNGMLQTRDAGFLSGFFCSGGSLNGRRAVAAYNVMHDSYDTAAMRWGALGIIYLDQGTYDVDVRYNLLWAAPGSHQRGMWFNTCCTNVREHDNVFHAEFPRGSADLRPDDFPGGKPFRFGHDFAHPPARPAWPPFVEQPLAVAKPSGASGAITKTVAGLAGFKDSEWFSLEGLDWKQGWQTAVLHFACESKDANADRSARAHPRHQKATDPLVLLADHADAQQEGMRKQWTFLWQIKDQAWVRFDKVPLGEGYRRFRIFYGNDDTAEWRVEVHLDRADGPLVGEVALPQTDKPRGRLVQIYGETVATLAEAATGTRDVFLVFRGPAGARPAVNFEYFRFEQYRGELPLQKKELRLELRAGGKGGPKVGEFYPTFSGGETRQFVVKLEPTPQAKGPLFVVVRSALAKPAGTLAGIVLQTGSPTPDVADLHEPPLRTADGQMLLPEVTNAPCARPNDELVRFRAARKSPPICLATRLAKPGSVASVADLPAWTASAKPLSLGEMFDGNPSPLPPSTAWIAYDEQAMYIVAKHPAKDPQSLRASRHLWDQDEGMEIALQTDAAAPGPIINLRGFTDGQFAPGEVEGTSADAAAKLACDVTYRADVTADGWTCQWRIPFAACGFAPLTAPRLRFNLAVHRADDSWLLWNGGGPALQLATGGTLLFPAEYASTEDLPRDGLAVWLDAASAATISHDSAGRVSFWKDRSGRDRDASQNKPDLAPVYVPAGLNGKPTLQFDERRTTRLELPDLSDAKVSATVFVVFANPTASDPKNHNARLFTASDGKGLDYKIGISANVPGTETGGPRLLTAAFTDRWAKACRIGCFSPTYQTYFNGQISEVLVYLRPLTPEERNRISAYLTIKWGL